MTSVYVPPATSIGDGSCSGSCGTASDARFTYLRGYFSAHMLSMPSHRYEYITLMAIAAIVIIIAAFYHSGLADQTLLGALWSKWAVKNRVVKYGTKKGNANIGAQPSRSGMKESKHPNRKKLFTFPSLGKVSLLLAIVVIPVVLTVIGADYIRPSAGVFDMSESWPNSSISIYTPGLSRRLEWGRGQYPAVTTLAPTITLPYRTWWTAGGRTGAMTNALTPFVVVIALKQIPFALLSTRLLGGLAFDRLAFMHKWGGRVVWFFATAHVVLWSIQLSQDQAFGKSIWDIVFMWTKFRWGFVSYGFFTLLILLSVGPMRANYYEIFFVCHIICIIGFMVTAWLHHPPLGPWMYVTLLYWLAERITRAVKVAFINGIGFTGRRPQVAISTSEKHSTRHTSVSASSSHTLHNGYPPNQSKQQHLSKEASFDSYSNHLEGSRGHRAPPERHLTKKTQRYDAVSDVLDGYATRPMTTIQDHQRGYALEDGPQHRPLSQEYESEGPSSSPPNLDYFSEQQQQQQQQQHRRGVLPNSASISTLTGPAWNVLSGPRPAMAADIAAVIRPGFAYAQLLPGKTLRLTLRTPNAFSWMPGQYVNLCIPSVRFWQSHPFTVASAYNAGFPSSTAFQDDEDIERGLVSKAKKSEERTIVLLLRARRGFTHHLWDYVRLQREKQIRAIEEETGQQYIRGEVAKTATGVHVRAIIDGPYGSSQRVRWGIYSTILIICGGSGISSGMAMLEYLCSVMAGNKQVKKSKTQRVRFVWMLREYSHLQWIASALRRCIELVPPELLQVDLYVTKIRKTGGGVPLIGPGEGISPDASTMSLNAMSRDLGDTPGFSDTQDSTMQGWSHDDTFNQVGRFTEGDDQEEYDVNVNDLTQFEGEDNSGPSAAEAKMNESVMKEGKLRRANTRKATLKRTGRRGGRGGPSTMLPRSNSAFEHQKAVHESSLRPVKLSHRPTDTILERDLGVDQGRHDPEWESTEGPLGPAQQTSMPASYLHPSTHLQPRSVYSSSHDQLSMPPSGSNTPTRISPLTSPLFSPTHFGEGGRKTPGEYANSIQLRDYPSTMHLNGARTPMSQYTPTKHYEGGDELNQVTSEVDAPIDLDEGETMDLQVVAELARPGYPKLDTILRQEAQQSKGQVLVSACGPANLGTLVRSIASKQINISEIRKGHMNGNISVICEAYDYG
ncbi:hypothetical protein CBS101457_004033 [Exobasidium rhododendri]|nr:hypothetical protein CBS101457_004033 [Exobasidium rhododendri]